MAEDDVSIVSVQCLVYNGFVGVLAFAVVTQRDY